MTALRDKTALVTGAAGGLGNAISAALAREGVRLVVSGRDAAALRALCERLRAAGGVAEVVTADLGDPAQLAALPERAEQALGPVDLLINNAGREVTAPFAEQAPEEIADVMQVNLLAPMLLTRALLPGMLGRQSGHIVQIASIGGKRAAACIGPYAASKAGLVALTQALRAELRGSGVGCSVICPGFTTGGGMYARQEAAGHRAPFVLGTVSATRVADAVIDAIRRDRPEVIVNGRPMRPLLVLDAMAPRAAERLADATAVNRYFRQVAASRHGERSAPPS